MEREIPKSLRTMLFGKKKVGGVLRWAGNFLLLVTIFLTVLLGEKKLGQNKQVSSWIPHGQCPDASCEVEADVINGPGEGEQMDLHALKDCVFKIFKNRDRIEIVNEHFFISHFQRHVYSVSGYLRTKLPNKWSLLGNDEIQRRMEAVVESSFPTTPNRTCFNNVFSNIEVTCKILS